MAFSFFRRLSPEYALIEAYADVKEEGLGGLKKHLTQKALKTIERVEFVGDLSAIAMKENPKDLLIGKMGEFEYEVIDMLKGKETARCKIGFNYRDSVEGTIEIELIKEEKEWKIDGLKNPHFDKLNLS